MPCLHTNFHCELGAAILKTKTYDTQAVYHRFGFVLQKRYCYRRESKSINKAKTPSAACASRFSTGAPKGIRTPGLPLRRGTLYPAELLAHIKI